MASVATKAEKAPAQTPTSPPVPDTALTDLIIEQKADKFAAQFSYQPHQEEPSSISLKQFAEHFILLQKQAASTTEPLDGALLWRTARVALDRIYGDDPERFNFMRKELATGRLPNLEIQEHDAGQAYFDISHLLRDASGKPKAKTTAEAMKNLDTTRKNSLFLLKNLGIK